MPGHKEKLGSGGVHYIRWDFLGGREVTTITRANPEVRSWVNTTGHHRTHGTTKEKPLEGFELEQETLRPLPHTPYDMAVWKQVKPRRDCHVVVVQTYDSLPFRQGSSSRCAAEAGGADLYPDQQPVATRSRAERSG